MAIALISIGAAGILLGLRFRIGALIGATLATCAASLGANLLLDNSLGDSLVSTLLLILILQAAYLLGLALSILWHRGGWGAG